MRIRRVLDWMLGHPWGPAFMAALAILGLVVAALAAILSVELGLVAAVNDIPAPVKVIALGVSAIGMGVACLLHGD